MERHLEYFIWLMAFVLLNQAGAASAATLTKPIVSTSLAIISEKPLSDVPFSISEVEGSTRKILERNLIYQDTLVFKLVNTGSQIFEVKGASVGGAFGHIWYGQEKKYDAIGHQLVASETCTPEQNAALQCSLVLKPGGWAYMQIMAANGALCNQQIPYEPPSVNSIRAKSTADVKLFYVNQMAASACPVVYSAPATYATCLDNWICTEDYECFKKYGWTAPDCISGGCGLLI